MIKANVLPYQLHSHEAGMFIEIYLPKKSVFQGTLYDTLSQGFEVEWLKSYFKDENKKNTINTLLQRTNLLFQYSDEMIDKFPKIFFGYSMYEVDGVFYSTDRKVYEERTQIVRLMFKPDLEPFFEKFPEDEAKIRGVVLEYLSYLKTKELFLKEKKLESIYQDIIDDIDQWIDYVQLFVYGYLMHEICIKINELCHENKMEWNDAEDEIWITSFWNFAINPVKLSPNFNVDSNS